MAIEVEMRGILTKRKYESLVKKLGSLGAKDLGTNDTETIFYVTDNMQLKVQSRPSKQHAKIAWKSGGLDGASAREEIELGIDFDDLASAEALMDILLPSARKVPTKQKRHDFSAGNVLISLKYSEHWSYHIELEELVSTEQDIEAAIQHIKQLALQLDVRLLMPDEEKRLVSKMLDSL